MKQSKNSESRNLNASNEIQVISMLEFLRRFALFIIITTLLCTLAGFGLAKLRDKPVYTASKSVLFFAQIQEGEADVNYDTQLSQYLFTTAESQIKSPKYVSDANAIYGKESKISASKIGIISNNSESLIFTISYSDTNLVDAKEKLQAVIDSAQKNLAKYMLSGGQINFDPVQNDISWSVQNSSSKYLIAGFLVGFIGSIAVSFILAFMDKTVKYKEELEMLSGASVIAVIEKV